MTERSKEVAVRASSSVLFAHRKAGIHIRYSKFLQPTDCFRAFIVEPDFSSRYGHILILKVSFQLKAFLTAGKPIRLEAFSGRPQRNDSLKLMRMKCTIFQVRN